ncbi:MAG: leucyl/phenylalanyl-tRNA--protein transferase [Prevotella sp.]|nr:leucyl/phenylalanyl-tRNA--protein transferase [Prevotella sp.]
MAVWQLDEGLWFPDPRWGEDDGLVAIGGDLSPERLILAYSNGFFPWYAFQMEREPHWYCPLDRYVIFPDEIHISHSMRQLLRQQNQRSLAEGKSRYEVTVNQDFDGVIRGCSLAQGRNEESGAWLGPDIIEAFTRLHRLGYAASVEVWSDQRLVGGLYGVTLRNAFFGESMFSLVPNASKLALIHLAKAMMRIGGRFIDCQFETPLFKSMGGRHITYDEYMKLLKT